MSMPTLPGVLVVFEIKKRPEAVGPAYQAHLDRLTAHLANAPGFISADDWKRADGTEVNVIRFASREDLAAFRSLADHLVAQQAGRESFFESYRVEVYEAVRGYTFDRKGGRQPLTLPAK